MYDAFYGFASEPFRLSPDAHFCFKHRSFAKAKSYFNYALHHGEGFVLVTGRPGTGKTTLIEDLLKDLADTGILTVRVDSGQVQADDLLRRVAYAFGLEGSGVDKATLLHRLEQYLHQRVRENGKALLIVDEAQTLPADALEELRLITNLTNFGRPLVQIFLVGQEALRDTISDPALEQLHQRVLCACHLNPLPLQETRDYLAHRLQCAGWYGDPVIESGAIRAMHQGSGGIPRLINKMADRLLLHGGLEEKHVLTADDAEYVLHELRAELLLKDEPHPIMDDVESDIQIEDIRLHQAPASGPELDLSSTSAPGQAERAAVTAAEMPEPLSPNHVGGLGAPQPSTDPRPPTPQVVPQPATKTVPTPGRFTDVFPPDELNRAGAPGEDGMDISAAVLGPAHDNGGVDPQPVLGGEPDPAQAGLLREPSIDAETKDSPATIQVTKDPGSGGAALAREDRFRRAPVNKVSEPGPSDRRRTANRGSKRRRVGMVLAAAVLMALGAALFSFRGEGLRSIDGVSALWSGMPDRLRQASGQSMQGAGETQAETHGPRQAATQAAAVPDSTQGRVAASRAPLTPQSEAQTFEDRFDDAPAEELVSAPPEAVGRLPGPETQVISVSTPSAEASVEIADGEPDAAGSKAAASPARPALGTAVDGDGIPKVSISSRRSIKPVFEPPVTEPSFPIAPSTAPGVLESSAGADRQRIPDGESDAATRETAAVAPITQPEFARSSTEILAVDPVYGDDASGPASATPRAGDAAEAGLADLVEAVQALGIETELVGQGKVRLILRNAVAFDFDSARVPAISYAVLDRLASVLVEHRDVRARIVGHTDHIGNADYNRRLSARRAAAIQRQLVFRGVAVDRLSSSGQGEDEPLVPLPLEGDEISREERIANRRIELWIEPIAGH